MTKKNNFYLNNKTTSKIIVIGNGAVGSAFIYSLVMHKLVDEIGIIDTNENKTMGDCLDYGVWNHSLPETKLFNAHYEDCADADIIVITAGKKQQNEHEDRLCLLKDNINLIQDITKKIMATSFNGIILVASNPVDILTLTVYKQSALPPHKVIGSGTLLDSLRYQKQLSHLFNLPMKDINAYILGEHGDNSFSYLPENFIKGYSLKQYLNHFNNKMIANENITQCFKQAQNDAYDIIKLKNYTCYGIAYSLTLICKAIIRNENLVLPISNYFYKERNFPQVYLGFPAILGANGVVAQLPINLDKGQYKQLLKSAKLMEKLYLEAINTTGACNDTQKANKVI